MRRSIACPLLSVLLAACTGPAATAISTASAVPSGAPPSLAASASPPATPIPASQPASPTPSGPILPTIAPTGPSWTARPVGSLLLESIVSVQVDRLNVREGPAVDARILGVVERGDFLRIVDLGPFSNDGYSWYAAVFLGKAGEPPVDPTVNVRDSDGIGGWIAVGQGDTRYVERLRPRCPGTIELASIEHLLGAEVLECFGSNTIELTGTFGCAGCGGVRPGTFEPEWLAHPLNFNLLTVYPVTDHVGPFVLHFPPGGPAEPPVGSVVRVRGHFDDAAADACAISVIDPLDPSGDDLVEIPAAAARLACAQQFVVQGVEVLGTDPGFVFG